MTVAIQIFGVEVPVVFFNGGFEDPSGEVCHHLREDIFAFVHNLRLLAATNLSQTLTSNHKMSKSYLNNL